MMMPLIPSPMTGIEKETDSVTWTTGSIESSY
jgi:hypothetical protein